jgi:glycosyltransferase involved in cell wall biosynthesis
MPSSAPLVSILIPAYNAEKWIAESIQSALDQTWPRTEIIVVNDGSTDRTLDVVRRFAAQGVSVVTQRNQGAAAARNKLLSLSQGDYIQWLDADDLLAPDKIASQIEALGATPSKLTLVSSAWGRFLYRTTKTTFSPTGLWCDLSPVEWFVRRMTENTYMQTSAWLVSRELTQAAGPWNITMLADDDGEYFSRIIARCDSVRFVPNSTAFYRRTGFDSLSRIGRSHQKMDAEFRSRELQIGYVRALEDSERTRAACVSFLQGGLINLFPDRLDLVERAKALAASLGGELEMPRFSWKYSWLDSLFGPGMAKRAQLFFRSLRWIPAMWWDKALLRSGEIFSK